jgi:hypothetical protein
MTVAGRYSGFLGLRFLAVRSERSRTSVRAAVEGSPSPRHGLLSEMRVCVTLGGGRR